MIIESFEKREQVLKFREKVLKAEQERLEVVETVSITEARKRLKERASSIHILYC